MKKDGKEKMALDDFCTECEKIIETKEEKQSSEMTKININPHLLRTVFTEKCREAGIDKEYINACCGRASKGMLEANYTVYSPQSLSKQYEKVEEFLILPFSEEEKASFLVFYDSQFATISYNS